jgi:hypothetical protein
MGFKFDVTNMPTDEERVAEALDEIEEGVKHVGDPEVWRWAEESPGMLMLLRDCATSAHGIGIALEIAFELGKVSVVRKADPAAWAKFVAGMDARARGRERGTRNGVKTNQSKAAAWHAPVHAIWLEKRGSRPETRKWNQDRVVQEIRKKLADVKLPSDDRTIEKQIAKWDAEACQNV